MWSDNSMIVVDRSLEDAEYNFDRDMGIDIRSGDFLGIDMLHYYLGVYVAEDRNSALTTLGRGDLGFLYNGRIEFLPLGNFDEVATDFDRNKPKLSIGAAYAYLQTDATSPYARQSLGTLTGKVTDLAKVDYKVHNFTADALFKGGGLTLLTAFHYRKAVDLPSAIKQAKNGIGWVAQAGYLFSNDVPIELQVNFGLIRAMKKMSSNTIPNNELGGGINYYFFRHAVKLQLEVARIWYENDMDKPKDETRVRAQFQVVL
jgi:phosphate-selective porin OprO/OprP